MLNGLLLYSAFVLLWAFRVPYIWPHIHQFIHLRQACKVLLLTGSFAQGNFILSLKLLYFGIRQTNKYTATLNPQGHFKGVRRSPESEPLVTEWLRQEEKTQQNFWDIPLMVNHCRCCVSAGAVDILQITIIKKLWKVYFFSPPSFPDISFCFPRYLLSTQLHH